MTPTQTQLLSLSTWLQITQASRLSAALRRSTATSRMRTSRHLSVSIQLQRHIPSSSATSREMLTPQRSIGTSSRLWDVLLPTLLLSALLRHSLTSASSVRKLQLRRCLLLTSQTRSLTLLRREQLTATTSVLLSSLRVS